MQLVPSLVEQPLFGVSFTLTVALLVGNLFALGYWARAEASARDGSVFGTYVMLASGFGLVYYVWVRYVRKDWEPRTKPADRRERLATAYSLALLVAFVVGAVVTPPEPITQTLALPPLFAASFVGSYVFVMRDSVSGDTKTAGRA